MKVEIRPEPDEPAAVVAAVQLLLSADRKPPPYRSAWRESGIRESAEDGEGPGETVPPRESRGIKRA
jgi:hypothetical protein